MPDASTPAPAAAFVPVHCGTCVYFDGAAMSVRHGTCHRLPPIVNIGTTRAEFPSTTSESWCGEGRARAPAARPATPSPAA